eukprot:2216380-Alexandrium_andersonii.AAC.1
MAWGGTGARAWSKDQWRSWHGRQDWTPPAKAKDKRYKAEIEEQVQVIRSQVPTYDEKQIEQHDKIELKKKTAIRLQAALKFRESLPAGSTQLLAIVDQEIKDLRQVANTGKKVSESIIEAEQALAKASVKLSRVTKHLEEVKENKLKAEAGVHRCQAELDTLRQSVGKDLPAAQQALPRQELARSAVGMARAMDGLR